VLIDEGEVLEVENEEIERERRIIENKIEKESQNYFIFNSWEATVDLHFLFILSFVL